MTKKRYTGYKFKKTGEKIYDGDILLIRCWRKEGKYSFDKTSESKTQLSEYETEEPRGDMVLHCGWNAGGEPLPNLTENKFLLNGNTFTKLVGIKKEKTA